MRGLSKSRYVTFCQCEKALWLKVYNPEVAVVDQNRQKRFEDGNRVGDLAMGLFGPYVEVTTDNPDGKSLNLNAMVAKTTEEMKKGTPVICEASFFYKDNYCAVDILRKTDDGWAIYEVKSFTNLDEDKVTEYSWDIAYQKWLLEHCGINVTGTFLFYLDKNYVRHGELDLQKLFAIKDMADLVSEELPKVQDRVNKAMKVLADPTEPILNLGMYCQKPYECEFLNYCKQLHGVPQNELTVFDLYHMSFDKQLEHYFAGRVTFDEVRSEKLSVRQKMQVECTLNGTEHIDRAGINKFLDTLSYPLYFLDFETMNDPIPQYDGTWSYQQVPFQYSLHIQESETSGYIHKEFLAASDGSDPRRALAEQLCCDIPMNVCVLSYKKSVESGQLINLANVFPDLAKHLLNISDNVKDLLYPFQSGYYYVPTMGGSFSIKSVLPALFPNDPSLNYHHLTSGVQNGSDAMSIFPKIKDMNPTDAQAAREALLRYCELDTWAMVKVLEKLRKIVFSD